MSWDRGVPADEGDPGIDVLAGLYPSVERLRDRDLTLAHEWDSMTRAVDDLTAENARLRAVVAGARHAIEDVLSDEQTDLHPPASIILRTVVRHLKEAT